MRNVACYATGGARRCELGQRGIEPTRAELSTYRSDPSPRMFCLSRLRASASTWSFHRCVVHSGRRGLPAGADCVVARRAGERSTGSRRPPAFACPSGMAVELEEALDLDVDMARLLAVCDMSGDRAATSRLAPSGGCLVTQVLLKPAAKHWTRIWGSPPICDLTAVARSLTQRSATTAGDRASRNRARIRQKCRRDARKYDCPGSRWVAPHFIRRRGPQGHDHSRNHPALARAQAGEASARVVAPARGSHRRQTDPRVLPRQIGSHRRRGGCRLDGTPRSAAIPTRFSGRCPSSAPTALPAARTTLSRSMALVAPSSPPSVATCPNCAATAAAWPRCCARSNVASTSTKSDYVERKVDFTPRADTARHQKSRSDRHTVSRRFTPLPMCAHRCGRFPGSHLS